MPTELTLVLVEDHDDLREEMVTYLQRPGWRVLGADSGAALNTLMVEHSVDLVVLYVSLPYEDGLSIAQRLRQTHPALGIVMLTARTRPSDRSSGYGAGADVYLTKPTNVAELVAVITNLLRRVQRSAEPARYQLLSSQRQLRAPNGHTWNLVAREVQLLQILALAPKQEKDIDVLVFEMDQRLETSLSPEHLAALISRLRQKLQDNPEGVNPITVQRGKGYRLILPLLIAPEET
ncbi:MAG: response regulator transcription factor [Burkholderiaceae bacterium]|nr:response regulator transcription factor [Burkholderiaceae bacterium]